MSRFYKKLLNRLDVAQPPIHLWRAIVFAIAAALILFTAFAVHPKVISVTADVAVADAQFDFERNVDTGNYDELAKAVDAGNYDELARSVDTGSYDSLISSVDVNHDMLIKAESGNYDQLAK